MILCEVYKSQPTDAIHFQIITLPPQCLTVGTRFFFSKAEPCFYPHQFTPFDAKDTEFALIREYYFFPKLK